MAARPGTEIEDLFMSIQSAISSLFKASIFIRNQTPRDKYIRSINTDPFDSRPDEMHILERYPKLADMKPFLPQRLAKANARRRQFFKYRRDHRNRLATDTANTLGRAADAKPQDQVVSRPPTVKEWRVTASHAQPSTLRDTEATPFVENSRKNGQTSMAEVAVSVTSFASFVRETDGNDVFPSAPAEANSGIPFECPYCFHIQIYTGSDSEVQWR